MNKFLSDLIACPSITPKDSGCIALIAKFLNQTPRLINRGSTSNAYFEFGQGPLLLFVGHTDVVPPGPLDLWDHDPFRLQIKNNHYIGRGIVDMKGAVFAFCNAFKATQSQLNGRVGILLTSDEEGTGVDGLAYAIPKLNIRAHWALVGEPTSIHQMGDTYKHERRGSHYFFLRLKGKQGHIAYPHLATNPSDILKQFLQSIHSLKETFPPDNDLSIYSIETSTHTGNIIPEYITIKLNLRYKDASTISQCQKLLQIYDTGYQNEIGAKPYYSNSKQIQIALTQAIKDITGIQAQSSKLGGTSDARFLPPIADEIIEFGLRSYYAHQINEQAPIQDISNLQKIYEKLLLNLLSNDNLTEKGYTNQNEAEL